MKRLSELIKESYILPNSEYNTFKEFLDINNIDENYISESAIEYYDAHNYSNWLERSNPEYLYDMNEMLDSTSSDKLRELLNYKFGNIIVGFGPDEFNPNYKNGSASFFIGVKKNSNIVDTSTKHSYNGETHYSTKLLKSKEGNDFEYMIKSHQYFISFILEYNDYYAIAIEPKFTEEPANKTNIGYHVIYTDERTDGKPKYEVRDKIRKVGIRPQVGVLSNGENLVSKERENLKGRQKQGDRYFPERIYLFLDSDDLYDNLSKYIKQKGWHFGEYIIFKVKLTTPFRSSRVSLFINPVGNSDNNVFTYDSIAKSNILEELTYYRDFKKHKQGDSTSEYSHTV